VSTVESSIGIPTSGFTITPTISQKTIGTSLGDVSTWTLDVSGSGSSTSSGETVQGSGAASVSYDSKLGLLVSMHADASGTVSGSSLNGPASITIDLQLTSTSVPLTAGSGGSFVPILIGIVAAVVVVVVVLVLFVSRPKNKTMSSQTEPGVLAPQQPPPSPGPT
jgi:hypothetical protein